MTVDDALQIIRKNPLDAGAWETIATDVYQPLLAYVASLLLSFKVGPSESAHDIVHDVLLAFYQRQPRRDASISSRGALHAYLRASCRNLLIDRYRHEQRAEQLINFLDLKFVDMFKSESNVYKSIFLEEIISQMSPECASLFRAYVTEDISPAEMADRVGASAATFYSRWHRCIKKAKEIFVQKKGLLKRL